MEECSFYFCEKESWSGENISIRKLYFKWTAFLFVLFWLIFLKLFFFSVVHLSLFGCSTEMLASGSLMLYYLYTKFMYSFTKFSLSFEGGLSIRECLLTGSIEFFFSRISRKIWLRFWSRLILISLGSSGSRLLWRRLAFFLPRTKYMSGYVWEGQWVNFYQLEWVGTFGWFCWLLYSCSI